MNNFIKVSATFMAVIIMIVATLLVVILVIEPINHKPKTGATLNQSYVKGSLVVRHITINGIECVFVREKDNTELDCNF